MLSIVYITFRENCKFEWFIDSLKKQAKNLKAQALQIIVVDGMLNEENLQRRQFISEKIGDDFDFIHVSPKPTVWQGKYRVTSEDYFAAANTRNTGVCYAKYDYIAFHDDLGCPSQTWLKAVLDAKELGQVHCGAYTKLHDLVVENGEFVSGTITNGTDCRLDYYKNDISPANASHFFGSSFCMPTELYFQLNGINEMCDGNGGEDYEFGMRILKNGTTFYYNKFMFIRESETAFGSDLFRKCIRADPKIDPDDPCSDFSHFMLNYTDLINPSLINPVFSLKEYNQKIVNLLKNQDLILENFDDIFLKPVDHIHFFTGKMISEGLSEVSEEVKSARVKIFNWKKYILNYPDLQKAGINTEQKALNHYNRFGKSEGRIYW